MADATPSPTADLRDEFPASPARDAVVALVRAYGAVQRLMEPYFARFGLTPPQFQALTIINRLRDSPLTHRGLAGALYVSSANVTVLLGRLERKGLVRRTADAGDRRRKFVRLTRRGRDLLLRIWQAHQQQLDRVMAGLTLQEQSELVRLLNRMMVGHERSAPHPSDLPTQETLPC